jgi:predicted HTH transcriptional regulator
MFLERNPTKKKYEFMEEIEQKIKETREEAIIAYIEQNKPVTFQDLMERFKVNELYAKTLLTRVTKLKV